MTNYIELSYGQVALAASLILINALVSLWLRLGLERSLLIASLRTIVQLSMIGLVLQWVFRVDRWYIIAMLMITMTLIAGWTARQRTRRKYPGITLDSITAIWFSAWTVTAFGLFAVLHGPNHSLAYWYRPQYSIPLLGMILGNTLNGVSIGLKTFTDSLYRDRDQIESLLALGATRWEAARATIQNALITGLTPIINSMMVVGLVNLPGMMTGQLLAGSSPIAAVKYQIVIMFLIAAATALGTVGIVMLSYRRLFNRRHQLQTDLLVAPS